MKEINWCKNQKQGIRLIEPNENLSKEYFDNAEESMDVLKDIYKTKSNMWLATTKYYIKYFAIYSILMKLGVKCEIHDCTIALVNLMEREKIFPKGMAIELERDKNLRIDNQYYLRNKPVEINFEKLSDFLLQIKEINECLDLETISKIRKKIERI